METLPEKWSAFLRGFADPMLLDGILRRVEECRAERTVYPPRGEVFRAFALTPPESVRVVLLGQDPYHGAGQAQGMAFSVPAGTALPPSLRNVFREFSADLGATAPENGDLSRWARGGVLLLNAVLTVEAGEPGSHRKLGWERFTDSVISALSASEGRKVFLLWGAYAQAKRPLIDSTRHTVLQSAHPSPFSARRGFFGSRPFSAAERALSPWRWPR